MEAIQHAGRVLVYGGKGALGSSCVAFFKSKNWWVGSIDMNKNESADENIIVEPKESWVAQYEDVLTSVKTVLKEDKVDALICVAGGWAGGNAASDDIVKNSDMMWKQSVWPSVISANIAAKYLSDGGLLALTGAKAALRGTPDMIGYGMAKAAVHHLVSSLADPKSGLPLDVFTTCLVPITLDTPMNRQNMPDADHSTWTPPDFVAELLFNWAGKISRPRNGTLSQFITNKGSTIVIHSLC